MPTSNYGTAVVHLVDSVTNQPVTGGGIGSCGTSGTPTAGPTGTFTIPQILVGTDSIASTECVVNASAPGYYQGSATLTINAGLTTTTTIALLPQESTTITGTVTDTSTGLPIAGIEIFGAGGATTTTDSEGHYSVSGNELLGYGTRHSRTLSSSPRHTTCTSTRAAP